MSKISFRVFLMNVTATTEIYTLSLHDALPISVDLSLASLAYAKRKTLELGVSNIAYRQADRRSEEHTSELQSLTNIVCRLLREKKKERSSILPALQIHTKKSVSGSWVESVPQ